MCSMLTTVECAGFNLSCGDVWAKRTCLGLNVREHSGLVEDKWVKKKGANVELKKAALFMATDSWP